MHRGASRRSVHAGRMVRPGGGHAAAAQRPVGVRSPATVQTVAPVLSSAHLQRHSFTSGTGGPSSFSVRNLPMPVGAPTGTRTEGRTGGSITSRDGLAGLSSSPVSLYPRICVLGRGAADRLPPARLGYLKVPPAAATCRSEERRVGKE